MYHPTIFFNPHFVMNVIAGFGLTVAGAVLLLAAAVWFAAAGEWSHGEQRPAAWRALCTLGFALFIAGWVWQIVGYYRVGAVAW